MKYLQKKFSVYLGGSKEYEKNYNRIFRKPLKEKIKEKVDNALYNLFLKGGL